MANIPGAFHILPGVFGPINYPVKKVKEGFYIQGYSSHEFIGSAKEIAMQILHALINSKEGPQRKHYAGPFSLYFSPSMRCSLCMNPDPDPPDLDYRALCNEITEELQKYISISIKDNIITPHITMANIPGGGHTLPSADPPYPVNIGDSSGGIKTDNCGLTFEVIGDKYIAAKALIEYVIDDCKNVTNHDFRHREGAIRFIFKDHRIVDIQPEFQEVIPHIDWSPEKRPAVLEMIELAKRTLKMMVFL